VPDRVAADNPSVETIRATLARAGRTDRPKVALPDSFDVPEGSPRLVLDDHEYHARIELSLRDEPEIRGAYDNARLARTGEGENRLAEWVAENGLEFGRSVLVDVVLSGQLYGLRAPGDHAVYEVSERDEGLASIAEEIERGEGS
jgi:hypothetical protein